MRCDVATIIRTCSTAGTIEVRQVDVMPKWMNSGRGPGAIPCARPAVSVTMEAMAPHLPIHICRTCRSPGRHAVRRDLPRGDGFVPAEPRALRADGAGHGDWDGVASSSSVTIGLTGKQYVLNQIQAIGANMMIAEYAGGGTGVLSTVPAGLPHGGRYARRDGARGRASVGLADGGAAGARAGGRRQRARLHMLGVNEQYRWIRNLEIPAGRFFDADDVMARREGRHR